LFDRRSAGAVHGFEIRRHSEQRRVRLRADDVREAKRLLAHAWIAPLAVDHGLETAVLAGLNTDFAVCSVRNVKADYVALSYSEVLGCFGYSSPLPRLLAFSGELALDQKNEEA
jgi:hypothetical protein